MRKHLYAFLAGAAFAFGLAVSGMSQPSKVRGFLDFFGDWNMTMLFVLGPAVCIYLLGTKIAKRKLPKEFTVAPDPERMGARFFIGSTMFGIGWGMVGICPGPAIVLLGQASLPVFLFFACLLAGIGIVERSRL